MCAPNSADNRHGRFSRIAEASSATPRQKSTRLLELAKWCFGFAFTRSVSIDCHSSPRFGFTNFPSLLIRRSSAARNRGGFARRKRIGETSLRTLGTDKTPLSPIIVSDLSFGRDQAASQSSNDTIAIFDAADREVRCHFFHRNSFVGDQAGGKGRNPECRTKKSGEPGENVTGVLIGAADFEFIFGRPCHSRSRCASSTVKDWARSYRHRS